MLPLRSADRQLRAIAPGDHLGVYEICRSTMAMFVDVHMFHIAFINSRERMTTFVYGFSNGRQDEGGPLPYGRGGLTEWLLASRKPYRWSQDDGALMRRGHWTPTEDAVRDSLTVPLFDEHGDEVLGLMTTNTTDPDQFDDDAVAAAQWLASAMMAALRRSSRPGPADQLYPDADYGPLTDEVSLLDAIGRQFGALRSGLASLRERLGDADPEVLRLATALERRCDAAPTDLYTRAYQLIRPPVNDPLKNLTQRETEVALALAAQPDLSNEALAKRLHISVATVKTHVANTLAKLELQARSEVRWLLATRLHPAEVDGLARHRVAERGDRADRSENDLPAHVATHP